MRYHPLKKIFRLIKLYKLNKYFGALLIIVALFNVGCSSVFKSSNKLKSPIRSEVDKGYEYLLAGSYQEANTVFSDLVKSDENSGYLAEIKIGLAQSKDGLEMYSDAQKIYRELYTGYVGIKNEIAANALYLSSYSYEKSGDDLKALAALHDLMNYSNFLKQQTARAEIFARLAIIYAKQQKYKEAQQNLAAADREISKLKNIQSENEKQWLARAYFQMGSITTAQLSVDNVSAVIRGQKMVQGYLIKSMSYSYHPWSENSKVRAVENFRDIWNVIKFARPATGSGVAAVSQMIKQFQIQKGSELIDLIDSAELIKPILDSQLTKEQAGFYDFLSVLKKDINSVLYEGKATTILTQQSERVNQIKKQAHTRDDIFFKPMLDEIEEEGNPFSNSYPGSQPAKMQQ